MPELPEVETVRRILEVQLGHPTIKEVKIAWNNIIAYPNIEQFCNILEGKTILDYKRIGKYLIFDLGTHELISHLRMEGKYFVEKWDAPFDTKHTHVFIRFVDGRELRYHDTRKFGRMYVYEKQDYRKYDAFKNTGYDVFDECLNATYLYKELHGRNIVLKQALLDQHVMAGIGNIYADEICFAMGMHPNTKVSHLCKKDFEKLLFEVRRILSGAIAAGGTTIRSYTSSLGVHGRFQLKLKVHAKEGAQCPICQTSIKKIKVATRGTCYCPKCQKKK